MLNVERLEAVGSRGEACIIVRTSADAKAAAGDSAETTHRLATGEQLRPTDAPNVFETRDGRRQFTLRTPAATVATGAGGNAGASGFAASQYSQPQE